MKVLFLDFDGVLNYDRYVRTHGNSGLVIDPSKMVLLKRIIDATDARIVLSTSWREHWGMVEAECDDIGMEINRIFKEYRLEIYSKTPKKSFDREKAIQAWLEDYSDVEGFVVLDDAFLDAPFLREHFVRTSNYINGLEEKDVIKAIEILNR